MKTFRYISTSFIVALSIILSLAAIPAANAQLTPDELYAVTIEKLNSNGTVTSGSTSLGLSANARADSNGKITFSIPGIPDNSSCNFLVITVTDSSGATVRKSIVPCPDAGATLPAGVSGLTLKQTNALLDAAAATGTDDPILTVFGFTIVRSTGVSAQDLSTMATLANKGITGSGGFLDYLTNNGVTSAQLATYRQSIVSRLADADTGYSKLIKDSVDAASATTELSKRGAAAGVLMDILVQAATTAGFPQDRVLEAFEAMGAIVVPLMDQAITNGTLSQTSKQMVDSSVGGGIQKIKAKRALEKYSVALTTLGASGDDVTTYQQAAKTLADSMQAAFEEFDKVFDGNETDTEIQSTQNTFETTMNTAFNKFITDIAVSDARLTTMIANIDSALGFNTNLSKNEFQFYKSDGTATNWAIPMVVLTDWASSIKSAGGNLTYTRDDTAIPSKITWIGTCSNTNFSDKNSCEGNGGTWSERTIFGANGEEIPTPYASLFGIQEDIMILEFTRFTAMDAAQGDMSSMKALEKSFATSVANLAGNIGGTTDGSTAVSTKQKKAIITLMQSPQF